MIHHHHPLRLALCEIAFFLDSSPKSAVHRMLKFPDRK